MATRSGSVHVITTKRTYKDKVYEATLLRRSFREDGKVKNETVANLSQLPPPAIEYIRRALRGEQLVGVDELFDVVSSPQHGHVMAISSAFRGLGMDKLLATKPCRERDLVLAMIAARLIRPESKLATTRWWRSTTIPEEFGVGDANEDDLYAAMDWLLKQQPAIEKKLAKRHLFDGGFVLYDLSSSYFEGRCCPLAFRGHSRDGKKGTLQVNYGLVTDSLGCPISVSVFAGNAADPTTLMPAVDRVRDQFDIESMVIVADRGMITQKQIGEIEKREGVDWITALRSPQIRKLADQGAIQLGLFDERNLFEVEHPDFPGERLVACRNRDLAEHRAAKRRSLIEATVARLEKIRARVEAGRLRGANAIGLRVGKIIDSHKVGKHFDLEIRDDALEFEVNQSRVEAEAALDGIYVIRTSVAHSQLGSSEVVAAYKQLSGVERAFRSLKTVDLHVRPIRHWTEDRVRAHIFLCMLTYYVLYHLQDAWRSLTFFDDEAWMHERKDIVAPAKRSKSADKKAATKTTACGETAHSVRTLIAALGGIVRNVCRRKGAASEEPPIRMQTQPNELQQKALRLAEQIAA